MLYYYCIYQINMESLTVPELKQKCKSLNIKLTKSDGSQKLKKDLIKSLSSVDQSIVGGRKRGSRKRSSRRGSRRRSKKVSRKRGRRRGSKRRSRKRGSKKVSRKSSKKVSRKRRSRKSSTKVSRKRRSRKSIKQIGGAATPPQTLKIHTSDHTLPKRPAKRMTIPDNLNLETLLDLREHNLLDSYDYPVIKSSTESNLFKNRRNLKLIECCRLVSQRYKEQFNADQTFTKQLTDNSSTYTTYTVEPAQLKKELSKVNDQKFEYPTLNRVTDSGLITSRRNIQQKYTAEVKTYKAEVQKYTDEVKKYTDEVNKLQLDNQQTPVKQAELAVKQAELAVATSQGDEDISMKKAELEVKKAELEVVKNPNAVEKLEVKKAELEVVKNPELEVKKAELEQIRYGKLLNRKQIKNVEEQLSKRPHDVFLNNDIVFAQKIEFPENARVAIMGDIHSSLHSFVNFIINLVYTGFMNDKLELLPNCYVISLGDLVDRGLYSLEILYLIFSIKCIGNNFDRLIILNGNHEDETEHSIYGMSGRDDGGINEYDSHELSQNQQAIINSTLYYLPAVLFGKFGLFW